MDRSYETPGFELQTPGLFDSDFRFFELSNPDQQEGSLSIRSIKEKRDKFISSVSELQRRIVEQFAANPRYVKLKDKIAFSLGVLNTVTIAYLSGLYPTAIIYWYLFWTPTLFFLRFVTYHKTKDHYFMLDFCYFSNSVLVFYLLFYPTSGHLFHLVYIASNGPLLLAIPTWRNSLVFHSLDKVTSVFIHAAPPIVCFCIRWYPPSEGFRYSYAANSENSFPFFQGMLYLLFMFIFWQACFLMKTEYVDRPIMCADPTIMTSLRYLTKDHNGMIYRLIRFFGRSRNDALGFALVQCIYTLVTGLPVKWMFEYQWFNLLVLVGCCSISVWNGSTFYFDKFASSYEKQLEELTSKLAENIVEITHGELGSAELREEMQLARSPRKGLINSSSTDLNSSDLSGTESGSDISLISESESFENISPDSLEY